MKIKQLTVSHVARAAKKVQDDGVRIVCEIGKASLFDWSEDFDGTTEVRILVPFY